MIALIGLYTLQHDRNRLKGAKTATSQRPFAPDFSLPALSGQQVTLSDYRGKVVLLDFWATWCEPCREEIPHLVDLQNKYEHEGLQIIGVSMDDGPQPVRDLYKRLRMNYLVVMGTAEAGERYGGVLGLPVAFLIGRDGRIYAKHIGATDISVFEKEVASLLNGGSGTPSVEGAQSVSRRFPASKASGEQD